MRRCAQRSRVAGSFGVRAAGVRATIPDGCHRAAVTPVCATGLLPHRPATIRRVMDEERPRNNAGTPNGRDPERIAAEVVLTEGIQGTRFRSPGQAGPGTLIGSLAPAPCAASAVK